MQVVGELRVLLVRDERVELREREVTRHPHVPGAAPEQVLGISIGFVDPAHVLGEQSRDDHVVADDRLRAHVSEVGVLEVRALVAEPLEIRHVEPVRVLRPHLVEEDDQDARRLARVMPAGPALSTRALRARSGRRADTDDERDRRRHEEPTPDPSHDSAPPRLHDDTTGAILLLPRRACQDLRSRVRPPMSCDARARLH